MKKQTYHFHVKINEEREKRVQRCIKSAPKESRIKNKTDLFEYMLDTFCEAIGVK